MYIQWRMHCIVVRLQSGFIVEIKMRGNKPVNTDIVVNTIASDETNKFLLHIERICILMQ